MVIFLFFFFKQKTAYEMRISDWSSDVCSSDLLLLSIRPLRWIGIGLLCAAMTGAGAGLYGYPFLSSHFHYADVPLVGAVPVASAIFFDLGVSALVVGATVLILIALAHQSIRVPRATREPGPSKRSEAHTSELQSLMRISFA